MHNVLRISGMVLLFATLFGACNTDTNITFHRKGDGPLVGNDEILFTNLRFYINPDSMLYGTPDGGAIPVTLLNTDSLVTPGSFKEYMSKLHAGDSASFKILATKFYFEEARQPMLPPGIDSTTMLTFDVRVDSIISRSTFERNQAALQIDRVKEYVDRLMNDSTSLAQMEIDNAIMDNYLAVNGMTAAATNHGVRVVISESGTGENAKAGDFVSIDYYGTLLDGTCFDTSIEEKAQEAGVFQQGRPYQPYRFQLGLGQVIPGWDEAIATLNKGTKATIIIPSPMGYGARGSGAVIGPNSVLRFDIEVADIEDPFE